MGFLNSRVNDTVVTFKCLFNFIWISLEKKIFLITQYWQFSPTIALLVSYWQHSCFSTKNPREFYYKMHNLFCLFVPAFLITVLSSNICIQHCVMILCNQNAGLAARSWAGTATMIMMLILLLLGWDRLLLSLILLLWLTRLIWPGILSSSWPEDPYSNSVRPYIGIHGFVILSWFDGNPEGVCPCLRMLGKKFNLNHLNAFGLKCFNLE